MSRQCVTNNYFPIDSTKMLLAIAIIVMHSQISFSYKGENIVWLNIFISSIEHLAVPMFFIFSGFFHAKTHHTKKSIVHLLKLYLFWIVISWPLLFNMYKDMDLIQSIKFSLFSGAFSVSWYLVALIWCMLILSGMKRIMKNNTAIATTLIIGAILYIAPTYRFGHPALADFEFIGLFSETTNKIIFPTIWSFPRGLLLFTSGYCIMLYGIRLSRIVAIAFAITSFALYFYECYEFQRLTDTFDLNCLLTQPVVGVAMMMVLLSYCRPTNKVKEGAVFRKASTLLYLSHPMIMFLIYRATGINGGWERMVLTLAVFVVGFIIYNRLIRYDRLNWLRYAC